MLDAASLSEDAKHYCPTFTPEERAFFEGLCAQERKIFIPEHAKVLADGTYVLARQLLFHWTVIQGLVGDRLGYFDRWCFETGALALNAIAAWPKEAEPGYEPSGWHRHPKTGRRRPDGEAAREYVEM